MNFYYDRAIRDDYIEIAYKCTKGIFVLWDKCIIDVSDCENVFYREMTSTDKVSEKEYLFEMGYLSCVLSA